jgi:hypothetical protein
VANVHRDRLDLSEVHQIELFGDELNKLRLQPADLLIVEGNGSKTEIGRCALWDGSIEDCVHQNHIIRVRYLAGLPGYLNAYWNSPPGNTWIMKQAASTSGLYTLSVSKVAALPVPLPPLAEQEQIVAEVEARLSVLAATEAQVAADLTRAARLRQAILKRAFAGKLVAQDPADEPASSLLARIRGEPAAVPTPKLAPKRGHQLRRAPAAKVSGPVRFRQAALVGRIVRRLEGNSHFGQTMLEKVLSVGQTVCDQDWGFVFARKKHGPFDSAVHKVQGLGAKKEWFRTEKRPERGYAYSSGPRVEEACGTAGRVLGDRLDTFDHLLDAFTKMDTTQAELFATVHAAWNDLLLDGRPADEDAIVREVYGWHPDKEKFTPDRIHKCIEWIRQQGFTPTGTGKRTVEE